MTATVTMLDQAWPLIPWREPMPVEWPDARLFACRICIANRGLKRASEHQWPTEAEAKRHIMEHAQ